jgi:group II intron reverse transcriptase/maturase
MYWYTVIRLTQVKSLFNCGESGDSWTISDVTCLSIKGLIQFLKSGDKKVSLAHYDLTRSTLFNVTQGPVWMNHFNCIYRPSRFKEKSKLLYAISYRSFSSNCRSDVTVMDESPKDISPAVIEQRLLDGPTICEVRQTYIKSETNLLFNVFSNKINRASKKVQKSFTYNNIYYMFISLELALKNHSHNGYYKYNLFELLCNPCFLLYCYTQLKRGKSIGLDDIPIENVTLPTILSLSVKLASKTYKPSSVSRVFIPTSNGKMRPLGISSATDKIVQKGILIFLEPVFEKKFLKCSYGFQKNKSCHSCLSQIYYNWTGTKWFIEADFKDCFDKISHPVLLSIINKEFFNYQISQVISSLLKIGYVNFGASLIDSKLERKIGTPQGSIQSPLFCNILLHELDSFVVSLCKNVFRTRHERYLKKWKVRKHYLNTPWEDIWRLIKSKIEKRVSGEKINKVLAEIRSQNAALQKVRHRVIDENWRRLTYVRYADDFLLGFIGPKKEAVKILLHISWFVDLCLGMTLNTNETGVRHHEKGVYFLGYKIWKKYGLNIKWTTDNLGRNRRNKSARLNFSIPLEKLFLRYSERGFLQKATKKSTNKFVGKRQDKWVFFTNDEAIIHRFNSVLRGIANYYSGSTQQSVLNRLYYALKKSASLTIAHRNSKKYANWTLKKYGKDMVIKTITKDEKEKIVKLFMPKTQKMKWHNSPKGQLNNVLVVPTGVPNLKTLNVVCSAKNLPCAIPNCPNKANDWHHIKHRKRIKGTELQKKITAYIAKQIALCKKHYLLIHNGMYDGPSLRKLKGYSPRDFD